MNSADSEYLELCRDNQLRCLESQQHVDPHKRHDGHEDGEVADELPQLAPPAGTQTHRVILVPSLQTLSYGMGVVTLVGK